MRTWHDVSHREPCRICDKPDWCSFSADGTRALCRRLDTGEGIHKVDKSGANYWLYRMDGHTSRQSIIELPSQPCRARIERADPATLDRVYRALLAALPLSSTHRQALRQRGLPDVDILCYGYRTLPRDGRAALARRLVVRYGSDTCARVPGLWVDTHGPRRWWALAGAPGLLIPVRNIDNRIVALKVRADSTGESPKYTYLSSRRHDGPGPGTPVHVPLHAFSIEAPVRLTEGELKADVATALSGVLTIAVPGVTLWRQALPLLNVLQPARVLLAFDADWRQNPHVARALAQATQALVEAGLTVVVETWDASQGKGIDDVLAAGYMPALQSTVPWLHRARTLPEKSGGRPSHIVVEVQ
jgi:hypothetical protein